jgi:F-box protein 21
MQIAYAFMFEYPMHAKMSIRERAKVLFHYLVEHGILLGFPEHNYDGPDSSFIGQVLYNRSSSSTPLVTCAIFSAVADRLGMIVKPIRFIWHTYVCVYPAPGRDLDGGILKYPIKIQNSDEALIKRTRMFMDPSRGFEEVAISDLVGQLLKMGIPAPQAEFHLEPLITSEAVHRCAAAISDALAALPDREGDWLGHPLPTALQPDLAVYASLWAIMLTRNDAMSLPRLGHYLQKNYPMDIALLESNWPNTTDYQQSLQFRDLCHVIRTTDLTPKNVSRRVKGEGSIIYKIGQVFRHKRYGFLGIISGWDRVSHDPAEHITQPTSMRCPMLVKQRTFYHVIVSDRSTRYIAEHNIEPVWPESIRELETLISSSGRFFKRWNNTTKMFVSNIRDEYPDD